MVGSAIGAGVSFGLNKLFGDDKPQYAGGGSNTQEVVKRVLLPGYLSQDVKDLAARASDFANQPYQSYTGQRFSPFTADQLAAFAGVRDLQGQTQPLLDAAAQAALRTSQGITPEDIQRFVNPYQQNVTDISKREVARDAEMQLQDILDQEKYIGSFGGDRTAIAESELRRNALQQLSDIQTQGDFQGYQSGLQAALANAGLLGSSASNLANVAGATQGQGLQALQALLGTGGQQQALNQARRDFDYSQFVEGREYPARQMSQQASILYPLLGESSTGSGTNQTMSPGMGGGTAALVGAVGGNMLGNYLGGGSGGFGFGQQLGQSISSSPMGPYQPAGNGMFSFLNKLFYEGGLVENSYAQGGMVRKENMYADGGLAENFSRMFGQPIAKMGVKTKNDLSDLLGNLLGSAGERISTVADQPYRSRDFGESPLDALLRGKKNLGIGLDKLGAKAFLAPGQGINALLTPNFTEADMQAFVENPEILNQLSDKDKAVFSEDFLKGMHKRYQDEQKQLEAAGIDTTQAKKDDPEQDIVDSVVDKLNEIRTGSKMEPLQLPQERAEEEPLGFFEQNLPALSFIAGAAKPGQTLIESLGGGIQGYVGAKSAENAAAAEAKQNEVDNFIKMMNAQTNKTLAEINADRSALRAKLIPLEIEKTEAEIAKIKAQTTGAGSNSPYADIMYENVPLRSEYYDATPTEQVRMFENVKKALENARSPTEAQIKAAANKLGITPEEFIKRLQQ